MQEVENGAALPGLYPPNDGEQGALCCDEEKQILRRRRPRISPSIIAISVSSLSASAAGLSQRMRWMRGKRMATPDLCRVDFCTASNATSNTSSG